VVANASYGQSGNYIAEINPSAAARVVRTIRTRIALLSQQPRLGRPGRLAGTRELIITGTRYLAPYRVTDRQIEILAVIHSAQRWPDMI
jgi:plasmid stabilization system protein ParE